MWISSMFCLQIFMMSGGAAEQRRSSSRPPQPRDEDDDHFYDCQETLEPPEGGGASRGEGGVSRDEGGVSSQMDVQQDATGMKNCQLNMSRRNDRGGERQVLQDDRLQDDGLRDDGLQEEVQDDGLRDDGLQDDGLQGDSDSEMKEDVGPAVEFDDDYLREVEKELTEEEKESRRQQSLTLKEEGNSQFKAGVCVSADWSAAGQSYTEALVLCPVCFSRERAVLFSNRAAARLHLDLKDQAISDCSRAIELNPEYLRALLRRAELYEQTEKLDEALEDYKKVLDRDPNHPGAREACMRLPQQIQERNEKLKEEMISKLKDLGNMILRPFGLSTNNFQVNQDSSSGSYSINFVQNPGNR
ncbi:tetratricopeptide repeat protein 1 isoform X1 [Amphiprion ocellaris]|uniref:tetratricopeptide repeat protein 1 isoform X1 n=2 Tax=Amphiprion ocellaris TaxID=80972 RepID=UPI0024115BC3|nr:tetratricopeptide repeat protein 1 isoform X1 [Amphiprion ocellaris]